MFVYCFDVVLCCDQLGERRVGTQTMLQSATSFAPLRTSPCKWLLEHRTRSQCSLLPVWLLWCGNLNESYTNPKLLVASNCSFQLLGRLSKIDIVFAFGDLFQQRNIYIASS
jgi:hypothetical protein